MDKYPRGEGRRIPGFHGERLIPESWVCDVPTTDWPRIGVFELLARSLNRRGIGIWLEQGQESSGFWIDRRAAVHAHDQESREKFEALKKVPEIKALLAANSPSVMWEDFPDEYDVYAFSGINSLLLSHQAGVKAYHMQFVGKDNNTRKNRRADWGKYRLGSPMISAEHAEDLIEEVVDYYLGAPAEAIELGEPLEPEHDETLLPL